MSKKSTLSTALWFIPLLAICLAGFLVLLFLIGRYFLKTASVPHRAEQHVEQTNNVAPVIPSLPSDTLPEEPQVPPEVLEQTEVLSQSAQEEVAAEPEICTASSVPVKIAKSKRKVPATPFERGLQQCKKRGLFPCGWEDNSYGVRAQYWLISAEGPIERGVYDMSGNLLSETIATLGRTVTSYTSKNTTWYFEAGKLVKIRTSPYTNCNLHDWFFINEEGRQDVCQCATTTQDCCARSPYREGMGLSYCELVTLDREFCVKK